MKLVIEYPSSFKYVHHLLQHSSPIVSSDHSSRLWFRVICKTKEDVWKNKSIKSLCDDGDGMKLKYVDEKQQGLPVNQLYFIYIYILKFVSF